MKFSLFEQRLTDMHKQERRASILQNDMYAEYRDFKSVLGSKKYFEFVDIKCFRVNLVNLRLGLLPLNSSPFNCLSPRDTTACCYCCGENENEKQLIYFRPLYDNTRARYLNGILNGRQSYNNLLRCDTVHTAKNLEAFVFYAMRIQKKMC